MLSASSQRVQDTLVRLGYPHEVQELAETTRSAAEAAAAIGCRVEQIAKSLVFRSLRTGRPVLVIASGANRVSEDRVGEVLIDEDLLALEEIWAAAGTPHAVFRLTPADLVAMTGGRVVSVT